MGFFKNRKSSKGKKFKSIKVKAVAPATAVVQLEDQIKRLIKKDKMIVKKLKPELKYQDVVMASVVSPALPLYFFGADIPHQKALVYPTSSWQQSGRDASKINNVRLSLRGLLRGNDLNAVGGVVTIYVLYYRRQRNITATTYYDAISGASGIGPFIKPDSRNEYTQLSFRDWENKNDWQVMGKTSIKLKPDFITLQNEPKPFFLNCKLKDVSFDFQPDTNTIVGGMCQILAVASTGVYPAGSTDVQKAASTGFNMTYNYRMTYYDA